MNFVFTDDRFIDFMVTIMRDSNSSGAHDHIHAPNRFAVISTPKKLDAIPVFHGRGIRIAFLDSGFFPHPDLENRIIAFHDVSGEENSIEEISKPLAHHWHGTQTTVVCAGNGKLSDYVYRGIASEAELVLVKVSENGRISEENIIRGLEWILEHREEYNIRILNISLGGDEDLTCSDSKIDQLAELCVNQGIVVIVAAGNSAESRSIPPANAHSVITVGGYSDENSYETAEFSLYHSNFGETADGIVKPEIIAPAMFVAAPILPNTKSYKMAEMLSWIASAPDHKLPALIFQHWWEVELPEVSVYQEVDVLRKILDAELNERKIVSAHYQHVDGTSYAAPITASVVAQMLEANPQLTPQAVKNILVSTAERLLQFPALRQGYGRLNAKRAVREAEKETHLTDSHFDTPPRIIGDKIFFSFHEDSAQSVVLAGDFNNWKTTETKFIKTEEGIWQAAIDNLPAGKYRYKFLVDGKRWIEDVSNLMKEPDNFGGFNSILHLG